MRPRSWPVTLLVLALAGCVDKTQLPRQLAGADPDRGRSIVKHHACASCHEIPGVDWPRGEVGGPLEGFANRPLIAGRFPNQPDVLVRWLRNAPDLAPATGMPPSKLTPAEARDVAAFLYSLDG
jgi:L-cysteine S-thiosulfotransferase